eukprot:903047-Prymnesium_polylepis.2
MRCSARCVLVPFSNRTRRFGIGHLPSGSLGSVGMVSVRACCACVRSRVRAEVWRGRSHPGALRRRGAATVSLLGLGALACVRRCVASLAAAHRCVVSMASG